MSERTLTAIERAELRQIMERRARWRDTQPPYDGYTTDIRMAHKLTRAGYLRRVRFSEHVRGEPRFYWWTFYITDKGMAAL